MGERGGKRIAGEGKKIGRPLKPKTAVVSIRVQEENKQEAEREVKKLIEDLGL